MFDGEAAQLGGGTVTLVEGTSFCLCDTSGDMGPGAPQGLFFRDTRILSTWQLRIDDDLIEPLTVIEDRSYHASFVGRARPRPGQTESTLLVERHRFIGSGMREDLVLSNLSGKPATCTVTIRAEADFADLFDVKSGRVRRRGELDVELGDGSLTLTRRWRGRSRGLRIRADGGATSSARQMVFRPLIPAHGSWRITVQVTPEIDGVESPPAYPSGLPLEKADPFQRATTWLRSAPRLSTDNAALRATLDRSLRDLGELRIFDPDVPDQVAVAAGAPWYMALFGRDSLITSYMALAVDPGLALGALETLARHQGERTDPVSEEQPGRIAHELRFGIEASLVPRGNVYYGTVDAAPLFVVLLGELHRWGLFPDEVHRLQANADRALEWIDVYGDRDGDGFVEYQRSTDRGLTNQGWKDSGDGVTFADGRIAQPPIALCEVQGYVYAAYLARALLAEDLGQPADTTYWRDRAARLKRAFNEQFWLPDRGWYALGLDRDKRPIDALASNMGHCLWAGIVDDDRAEAVAERLLSSEMFSGWGVRTLAAGMAAYNPMSYHNGSVWPHDNGIIVGGLMRYGFVEPAQRVALGILEAAAAFGHQLPELMCGFDRAVYPHPVPYPTACAPQAWASATPFYLLRALIRAEPCIPRGVLALDPALPDELGSLELRGVSLGNTRITLVIHDGRWRVDGLRDETEVVTGHRPCDWREVAAGQARL
ncbi:MAG TPA: glycogen debranching N-terminal domain-containing protein [Jiangellaceae bacterium]|nr:glycogen debranching N-terminal domain-containing protein [Jiangellaceae bacterium]